MRTQTGRSDSRLSFERLTQAGVSRRQFLGRGVAAVGAVAGLGLLDAASSLAQSGSDPLPIPGGFDLSFNPVPSDPFIHVLPPVVGFEMATITNFNGVVGAADIAGTANEGAYNFDADMRFMRGVYAGSDGRPRHASFGFI